MNAKPTFLNLPEAKRERFVDVALKEFCGRPYDQASITRIVAALGIAKGSVYQYFDGKLGLFGYLVERAVQSKTAWVVGLEAPSGEDLFSRLCSAYAQGLQFWFAEPRHARLLLRLLEPSVDPGLTAIRAGHAARAHAALTQMLAQAQHAGQVRPDLDPALTAHLMHGLLSEGLMRAFLGALDTDLEGLVAEPDRFDEDDVRRALGAADAALDLLVRGIAT